MHFKGCYDGLPARQNIDERDKSEQHKITTKIYDRRYSWHGLYQYLWALWPSGI